MQQRPPHTDESTSASPGISPGPVPDHEILLRAIIDPDHIHQGRIQPSAVPLQDLKQRGLSIQRREHSTRQELEAVIRPMLAKTTVAGVRRLESLAIFTTAAVRDIRNQGRQAFVVIDTAQPDNRAHASIYLADLQARPSLAREMREQLLKLMETRVTPQRAFAEE